MHPDAILAALRAELEEARDDDHRKAIKAEIERVDKLPRPAAKPDDPETVFDRTRAYLDALKVELAEAPESRQAEIKKEIKRVEDEIHGREKEADVGEPSAEEIEQRKQARTGRRVERATAAPGEQRGNQADEAETAPKGAEEK